MVDAPNSGFGDESRRGSNPLMGTKNYCIHKFNRFLNKKLEHV